MNTNMQNRECVETADRLLNRISVSTCSFTAADGAVKTLEESGFEELFLHNAEWQLSPGGIFCQCECIYGIRFCCGESV